MAAALAGEADSLDAVVLTSCRTITSCGHGGEVPRATQWIRAADDFNRRYGSPHLYATYLVGALSGPTASARIGRPLFRSYVRR